MAGFGGVPVELLVIVGLAGLLWAANNAGSLFSSTEAPGGGSTGYTSAHLKQASPEQFEKLVAEAWENAGYSTINTGPGADDGLDVIASNDRETVAIQAKRYTSKNVGAPVVRKTAGAADQFGADRAVIATSSDFSGPAYKAASKLDVELVSGGELARRLASR